MEINNEIKNEYPWKPDAIWEKRLKSISELMVKYTFDEPVLDLGGGMGHLGKFIGSREYLSLDTKKWTDKTIICDFNNNNYPELGKKYLLVCSGLLEYIEDLPKFLKRIKIYGEKMIFTYNNGKLNHHLVKNRLQFDELESIIIKAGWKINFEKHLSKNQKIYYSILK